MIFLFHDTSLTNQIGHSRGKASSRDDRNLRAVNWGLVNGYL